MIICKKIFFLFLILTSLARGGNLFFSIDDGTTNVKNHLSLYIYADEAINNSYANGGKIKSIISIKKQTSKNDKSNQKKIDFNVYLSDDNRTIEIQSVNLLNSGEKYKITILGSKLLDINKKSYLDNSVSFTAREFTKIIVSDKNITLHRGDSKTISVTLDSFLKNETYQITSKFKKILISPSQINFNQLNWDKPEIITITFLDGYKYINDDIDVIFTSDNSGFKAILKVSLIDFIDAIFDKNSTFTFTNLMTAKLKISKQPPKSKNKLAIELVSKNENIQISPSTVLFDDTNWNNYQEINITTSSKETIQDFVYISTVEQKKFNMKEAKLFVNFVNSDASPLKIPSIKNIYTDSFYAYIIYSLPESSAYKVKYKIYATKNKIDYSENSLLKEDVNNKTMLILKPNQTYESSVVASYAIKNDFTDINKTFTYDPIKISTNKILFKDKNNNKLLDGIENMLSKAYPTNYKIDSNNDNIPDSIQLYTASIFKDKNFAIYDNLKDSDGDKMPDLLEVSIGRLPNKVDFILPDKPNISNNKTRYIFWQGGKNETINNISKIRATDGAKDITYKAKAYYNAPCFTNDKLPYDIFTTKCKEIKLKELPQDVKLPIHWVVFDDDFNVDYKKQIVTLFEATKTISYKLSNFTNKIQSMDSNVLFALGKYSKHKKENNISLKLSDIPNISKEKNIHTYSNNIFDFRAFRLNKNGSDIIIPQIKAIQKNAKVRIFKDGRWKDFDTSDGDQIFTSTGRNKKCDIADEYYQQGVNEGSYCLKLRVKDGSINDGDGLINDIFYFTGGVATKNEFVVFETKTSSGCSSLNARGFSETKKKQNKIDPLLPIIILLSLLFTIKAFIRKS